MVTWTQMYMPMGGLGLSALVALIPIIFFFVALAVLRLKGHVAGAITLILSILIAIFAFKMPIDMAFAAAGYGFIYGLWPIAWIIVAAVFLYKLTVASGQFDIIRSSVISITDDQRLQVLLIGFSFGALLEGAAGFGAPVAITGALLVGLGFKPLYAAGLCLIANTAPVAFGALGVPILVAGQVTGIDPFHIGAMAGRQLPARLVSGLRRCEYLIQNIRSAQGVQRYCQPAFYPVFRTYPVRDRKARHRISAILLT